MNVSTVNAFWSMLAGENFQLDDPKLLEIVQIMDNLIRSTAPVSIFAASLPHPSMAKWPILRYSIILLQACRMIKSIVI